jgi:putative membrane protein
MDVISDILVFVVALLHFGFLYLEMFLWTRPRGLKVFGNTPEQAATMKVLAANQGLYNGVLGAGLIWSLLVGSPLFSFDLKMFFLGCVILAALFGAYTVSRRILFIQGLPAITALAITVAFANPYLGMDCCAKPQTAQGIYSNEVLVR